MQISTVIYLVLITGNHNNLLPVYSLIFKKGHVITKPYLLKTNTVKTLTSYKGPNNIGKFSLEVGLFYALML